MYGAETTPCKYLYFLTLQTIIYSPNSSTFTHLCMLAVARVTRLLPSPSIHSARVLSQRFLDSFSRSPKLFNRNTFISRPHHRRLLTMATNGAAAQSGASHKLEHVTSTLQRFGISEVPQFSNAFPELNPVDIYRAHITELLAPITGADPKVIYPAIQWTQTLEKGDCVLPVPALRLKGKKPDQVAKDIVDNVSTDEGDPVVQ
jgi:hypothetical protein